MTQTKRMLAIASAFALALLTGSAAALANSKERIGIDNVDKCDQSLRDPECTNDEAMGDAVSMEPDSDYGSVDPGNPFNTSDVDADDPGSRSDNLDDSVGLYQN
ncbi:MAG: hypothetical protein AB7F76_08445 [Parvibaculaceae bacterium]